MQIIKETVTFFPVSLMFSFSRARQAMQRSRGALERLNPLVFSMILGTFNPPSCYDFMKKSFGGF